MDKLTNSFADFIIKRRWWVITATFLVFVALAAGMKNLTFNNEYRVFFSDDNPHLLAFDRQQLTYTKNDNVLFVITPDNGEVFDRDVLSAVEFVTAESWYLPFALRVDSVSNFQFTYADGDDLVVGDLVEGAQNLGESELALAKKRALAEPFLVGQLINADASVTAVNITFQMPQVDPDEAVKVASAVRELVSKVEAEYPVSVQLSGVVMLSNAFFEAALQDYKTLIPAMYAIIIVMAYVLLRSIGATFGTVLVVFLSMLAAMGVAGWMGIKLTPPSASATTVIMTLAVADSIHFLVSMFTGMRKGMNRHDAIRYSLRLNVGPIFLTSLTTAVGFLSMNFSDAPPFHDLGNITAIGVGIAFVLSVSFLPALMAVLPARASRRQNTFSTSMNALAELVIKRKNTVLLLSLAVSVALLFGIPRNILDDNFIGYFDESITFRADADYINERLTGVYQIQYSLDAGEDYGVSEPAFLQKVDRFVEWARAQEGVTHVNTFTDTFKRINKNMHADDEAYYALPDDKELAAQYLLLYELSLPEGMDLNNQMDIGKSATQVIITLENMSSTGISRMSEAGSAWLEQEVGLKSYGVGPAVMFSYISQNNIRSMIVGTSVAIVIISLLITISLRNLRLGAISLVPNLLPLAVSFGLWGFFVGEVNVAVSLVSGMALGIVVDDSVHFLSKYLRARREQGLNSEDAVRYAFSSVGVAIVVTSMILVAGFLVLAQSKFGMNSNMALLTGIAITMALILDFLLLPALLLSLDKRDYEKTDHVESDTEGLLTEKN